MNYCCSDSAYVVREEAAADVNNEFLVNSIVTGVEVGDYINWNDCFGTVATSNLPKYVNYRVILFLPTAYYILIFEIGSPGAE